MTKNVPEVMVIQELLIKNMVCERCVWAVRTALEGLGYTVQEVELGRATVAANSLDLAAVAQRLDVIGLELLTDRNSRIASQIRVLIIDLIRSGNLAGIKTALSDYLASQVGLEYAYLTHLFSTTQNLTIEKFWVLQQVDGLATFDWRRFLGTFGGKSESTHEKKTCIRRDV